jgi:hypothetical protein
MRLFNQQQLCYAHANEAHYAAAWMGQVKKGHHQQLADALTDISLD